ncbi:MAG TPA: ATP-binding protein [Jatrophihabitans sp.]
MLPNMIAVDGAPDSPFLADVTLCASELVTASLVAQSRTMTLRLWREENTVRLSLTDDGIAVDDEEGPAAHAQQLGFRMIDAIVERWGIDAVDGGRELWVVLPVAADTAQNGPVT